MGPTEKPRRKKQGIKCPWWRRDVSEVCHTCELYVQLDGEDPQTGEKITDVWGCALALAPIAALQVSRDVRKGTEGIQKATELFRNDVAKVNRISLALSLHDQGQTVPGIDSQPMKKLIEGVKNDVGN